MTVEYVVGVCPSPHTCLCHSYSIPVCPSSPQCSPIHNALYRPPSVVPPFYKQLSPTPPIRQTSICRAICTARIKSPIGPLFSTTKSDHDEALFSHVQTYRTRVRANPLRMIISRAIILRNRGRCIHCILLFASPVLPRRPYQKRMHYW